MPGWANSTSVHLTFWTVTHVWTYPYFQLATSTTTTWAGTSPVLDTRGATHQRQTARTKSLCRKVAELFSHSPTFTFRTRWTANVLTILRFSLPRMVPPAGFSADQTRIYRNGDFNRLKTGYGLSSCQILSNNSLVFQHIMIPPDHAWTKLTTVTAAPWAVLTF